MASPHISPIGAEFRQLSRLLFDAAARKWYGAFLVEAAAGMLALVLGLIDLPSAWALAGALVGLVLLVVAYVLRLLYRGSARHSGDDAPPSGFYGGIRVADLLGTGKQVAPESRPAPAPPSETATT